MNARHARGLRRAGIVAAAVAGLVQLSAVGAQAVHPQAVQARLSSIVSSDGSLAGLAPAAIITAVDGAKGAGLPSSRTATVTASGGGAGADSIIGTDDRFPAGSSVYPGTATVLITFAGGGRCSGWMAGYNSTTLTSTIVTAGHCVHTGGSGGAWRTGIMVYPGYPSTGYGCAANQLLSVAGWTTSRSADHDYGAIKVSCSFSGQSLAYWTGWYGFFWTTASLIGTAVCTQGYPGDKPNGEQWASAGSIQSEALRLFYNNDVAGGQNGSAVYVHDDYCGTPVPGRPPIPPRAIAIHAYPGSLNSGVRITQQVFNNLNAFINA